MPSVFNHEGHELADSVEIANAFNTYFANIGKNLSSQIDQSDTNADYKLYLTSPTAEKMQEEVHVLKTEYRKLRDENVILKNQTNNIESYSRRDNLIIYGVTEPKNESPSQCEKLVKQSFVTHLNLTDLEAGNIEFVRCHRLYSNRKNAVKPVIVRFKNFNDRETGGCVNRRFETGTLTKVKISLNQLPITEGNCFLCLQRQENSPTLINAQCPSNLMCYTSEGTSIQLIH